MQLVWLPEQAMEDGKGVLADGTRYVRDSGEEFGANGFWQRWTRLRGVSAAGKVRMGRAPARISGMTWTLEPYILTTLWHAPRHACGSLAGHFAGCAGRR